MNTFLRAICVLSLAAVSTFGQAAPEVVRAAIIDLSGSMAGERIKVVIRTLLEWCEAFPPSKEAPFLIIPFSKEAGKPKTFTDADSFRRYVTKELDCGGATNIAAGLRSGAAAIRPYLQASNLILLLVSDGEDTVNPSAVPKAVAELDALFAERAKTEGLQNSVYVTRWDGANQASIDVLAVHATPFDFGSEQPVFVTLRALVALKSVRWEPGARLRAAIDVRFEATGARLRAEDRLELEVVVHPTCAKLLSGPVRLPRTGGEVYLELEPLGEPGELRLEFASRIATRRVAAGPVSPSGIPPVAELSIPVPRQPVTLAAVLQVTEPSWGEKTGAIACGVRLSLSASSVLEKWGSPLELDVSFGKPSASGPARLSIPGPGSSSWVYTLEGVEIVAGEVSFEATLTPVSVPWPLELDRKSLLVRTSAPAPKPKEVQMRADVRVTREPLWANLRSGLAALEAEVDLAAEGAPDGLAVELLHPQLAAPARAQFQGGKARVPVRLVAKLRPRERAAFDLEAKPVASVPGLAILPATSRIEVLGPAPAKIELAVTHGPAGAQGALALSSTPWRGSVAATPTVTGPLEEQAAAGLTVTLTCSAFTGPVTLPVGASTDLPFSVPELPQPRFDDTTVPFQVVPSLPEAPDVELGGLVIQVRLLGTHKALLLTGGFLLLLLVTAAAGLRIFTGSPKTSTSA